MLVFQDLPDTSTPINSTNLNGNFNEVVNLIKFEDITITITNITPSNSRYGTGNFTIPSGYKLLGLLIMNKHWVSQVNSSIINYNNSSVAVNATANATIASVDMIVRAIYIRNFE